MKVDSYITREVSIKRKQIINNKIYYEQGYNDLYTSICVEIGNDETICSTCSESLTDWKSKNKTYQSTFPIIKDAFRLVKTSLEKLVSKCKKHCSIALLNYTVHIGKNSLEERKQSFSEGTDSCMKCFEKTKFFTDRSDSELINQLKQKENEIKEIMYKYEDLLRSLTELKVDIKKNVEELQIYQEKIINLETLVDNLKFDNKMKEEQIKKFNIENESVNRFNAVLRAKLHVAEERVKHLSNEKNQLRNEKIEGKLDKLQGDVLTQINRNKLLSFQDTIENYIVSEIKKDNEIQKLKDENQDLINQIKLESIKKTKEALKDVNNNNNIQTNNHTNNTGDSNNNYNNNHITVQAKSKPSFSRTKSCYNLSSIGLPVININNLPQKIEKITKEIEINNKSSVFCLTSFNANNHTYIACGGVDTNIKIYNFYNELEEEKLITTLYGHRGIVWSLCTLIINDKPILVSGSVDSSIKLWDPFDEDNQLLDTFYGHFGIVWCLTTIEINNMTLIISGGFDKTVKIWNPLSQIPLIMTLRGHTHFVTCLTTLVFENKTYLVSGSSDKRIKVWDIENTDDPEYLSIEDPLCYLECITTCTFNKKQFIVTGGGNYTIKLLDIMKKQFLITLRGHEDTVTSLASMTMDHQTVIVSSSLDKTIKIWDPINERLIINLDIHTDNVSSLIIIKKSDDQQAIVSGSWDQTIKIWT